MKWVMSNVMKTGDEVFKLIEEFHQVDFSVNRKSVTDWQYSL